MSNIILTLLLIAGNIQAQIFEQYDKKEFNSVRLHYVITNSLLGAVAGATLAGSNAKIFTSNQTDQILVGLGGAVLGSALGGYLGYPGKKKFSGNFEKIYFMMADGFIGALTVGFATGFLADFTIPHDGDIPTSGIIGGLIGGVCGGIIGGVYGYRFAVQF